jgi:hypothetical protein
MNTTNRIILFGKKQKLKVKVELQLLDVGSNNLIYISGISTMDAHPMTEPFILHLAL